MLKAFNRLNMVWCTLAIVSGRVSGSYPTWTFCSGPQWVSQPLRNKVAVTGVQEKQLKGGRIYFGVCFLWSVCIISVVQRLGRIIRAWSTLENTTISFHGSQESPGTIQRHAQHCDLLSPPPPPPPPPKVSTLPPIIIAPLAANQTFHTWNCGRWFTFKS